MKALSIWQPWASLLAHGVKTVETRGWDTQFRGRFLIHASKKWSRELLYLCQGSSPLRAALETIGVEKADWSSGARGRVRRPQIPFGYVIGSCKLESVFPVSQVAFAPGNKRYRIGMAGGIQLPESERWYGNFDPNRFAWCCSEFKLFTKPIPCRGKQGWFDLDIDDESGA